MSRGTDYNRLKPKGHAIQPTPNELITKAREICERKGYRRIFLKAEEQKVIDLFRDSFGDRLLNFKSVCFDDYSTKGSDVVMSEYIDSSLKESKYELNYEYIRGIYGASKCDALLTGLNSGSAAAVLLNNMKYQEKSIMFTGLY